MSIMVCCRVSFLLVISWLLAGLVQTQNVPTMYIADSDVLFAINLPADSDDVNFFLSSPTLFAYTGIGFGSVMAGSLMVVAHAAADNLYVTISPRLATGNSEPAFFPAVNLTVNAGTAIQNDSIVVNATCHGCRSWPTGSLALNTTVQPFIYALGPLESLQSDSLDAPLRRHAAHGHFTMDMTKAVGAGGIGSTPPQRVTVNAVMAGRTTADGSNVAHGVLFTMLVLVVAPLDALVALALRRWPALHMATAVLFFAFFIGGLATGVRLSRLYIATQKMATGHQVLGIMTLIVVLAVLALGAVHGWSVASAKRSGLEPSRHTATFKKLHAWTGRVLWLLLVVNNGIGLQLAHRTTGFLIGYAVLVVAVVLVMVPVYGCFWWVRKGDGEKKEEPDEVELGNIDSRGH